MGWGGGVALLFFPQKFHLISFDKTFPIIFGIFVS